ncbi:hypothetical protein FKM82_007332 [Ascaphus truei]
MSPAHRQSCEKCRGSVSDAAMRSHLLCCPVCNRGIYSCTGLTRWEEITASTEHFHSSLCLLLGPIPIRIPL